MSETKETPDLETPSTRHLAAELQWEAFQEECRQSLPCTACNGTGTQFYKGFQALDNDDGTPGKFYPDRTETCLWCDGQKVFPGFEILPLVRLCFVLGKDGKVKRFYRSRPEAKDQPRITQRRVYYLWRMARFHGGVDICLPMEAASSTKGDPLVDHLEVVADALARMLFRTDKAAAYRWGRLLIDPTLPEFPPGQPLTASSNYPAVTEPERHSEPTSE